MQKVYLNEQNGYFFADFGKDDEGKNEFRLWVPKFFAKKDDKGMFITFPIQNAIVETGKSKHTKLLKPMKGTNTYFVYTEADKGCVLHLFRNPIPKAVHSFRVCKNPEKREGIDFGSIASFDNAVKNFEVSWRRYSKEEKENPSGTYTFNTFGKLEVVPPVQHNSPVLA